MNKQETKTKSDRADDRREQILDAATEVFSEVGFHRATVRSIAQRAGLADGTLYLYFENKGDLLFGLLNRLNRTEERPRKLAEVADDFSSRFSAYFSERMVQVGGEVDLMRALLPEVMVDEALRDRYRTDLLEPTMALAEKGFGALADSGMLGDADGRVAVRTVSATLMGLLMLRMLGDDYVEENWSRLAGEVPRILAGGLVGKVES